jgi:hypothetical protein
VPRPKRGGGRAESRGRFLSRAPFDKLRAGSFDKLRAGSFEKLSASLKLRGASPVRDHGINRVDNSQLTIHNSQKEKLPIRLRRLADGGTTHPSMVRPLDKLPSTGSTSSLQAELGIGEVGFFILYRKIKNL